MELLNPQLKAIYIKICVSQFVCLSVCPFFSPPSHCSISNLSTDLESLGHRGANKNIYKPIKAEIKILEKYFLPIIKYVCPKLLTNVCPKQICVLYTTLYRGSEQSLAPEARAGGAVGAQLRVILNETLNRKPKI